MDIIGLMETPINEMQYSSQKMTSRINNALRRNGFTNFASIIYWKKEQANFNDISNLGNKCYEELKQKLKEYGINIEDKKQCDFLINEYIKEKTQKNEKLTEVLDTPLEAVGKKIPYQILDSKDYTTLYDIVNEDKTILKAILEQELGEFAEWNYFRIRFMFINYGIDIENEEQCRYLIEKHKKENNKNIKDKKLNKITEENNILEKRLTKKQKVLTQINEQLERRKRLEQQLAKCDEEYYRLVEKYNTMKEGKNHGTK